MADSPQAATQAYINSLGPEAPGYTHVIALINVDASVRPQGMTLVELAMGSDGGGRAASPELSRARRQHAFARRQLEIAEQSRQSLMDALEIARGEGAQLVERVRALEHELSAAREANAAALDPSFASARADVHASVSTAQRASAL